MRLQAPIRFQNKLSQHSVLALVGLMAFAAILLSANPFGVHAAAVGSNTGSSAVSTGLGLQSAQQGSASAGQGSLLTGSQVTQSGSGHHHHGNEGNTTSDY